MTRLASASEASTEAIPLANDDQVILGESEDSGVRLEAFGARTSLYLQRGRGYQSQDGPIEGPGSEDAWILQPAIGATVRQNAQVRHDIYVGVDIVTAASADAVDLVSSASRVNESVTIDVMSTLEADADNEYSLRYGLHNEEHFRSFQLGAAFLSRFAEDNATATFSVNMALDNFDPLTFRGRDDGAVSRGGLNFNIGFSQVLSRTTLFDASYGLTAQLGTLETTWNSVPTLKKRQTEGGPVRRLAEELPSSRYRNAFSVRLAQHVPISKTTVKGSYRLYLDTFGLLGNTTELSIYQYLVDSVYLRASYRLHHQTGADAYTELAPADINSADNNDRNRTADSDLAPMAARELGAKIVLYASGGPGRGSDDHALDASYCRYWRTNDLHVDMLTIGYSGSF